MANKFMQDILRNHKMAITGIVISSISLVISITALVMVII
jgi:hypothetical protein